MTRLKPIVPWLALFMLVWPWDLLAIDARLLPEGVTRIRLYQSWSWAEDAYDASGHRQPLGQMGLDKLAAKGVAPAAPNLYAIQNDARYTLQRTDLTVDYGWNTHLDLGIWIPILDANLTQSAVLNRAAGWDGLPTAQKSALTVAVSQLDNTDANHHALGDILLGIKGQLVGDQKSPHRFSLGGGVRLPTGHVANPLDPRDTSTGDGQWDLTLWSWYDHPVNDNFFINLHTRHEYGLPGSRSALLPTDATRSGRMEFQPGLHHDVQLEPQWRYPLGHVELMPSVFLIYSREEKGKQQGFDRNQAAFAGGLYTVEGTDWQRLLLKPTLGLGLIPMGVPVNLYLALGTTLWGRNTPEASVVELRMDFFFQGPGHRKGTNP
ncbi:MAG: hypothetical protein H7833_04790 [Magnetococcus sp. DMHC-1]|nr:hypothetical protein [Magnetococcales bacterium]